MSGWVYMQPKPLKWVKRWLVLRDGNLFFSKGDSVSSTSITLRPRAPCLLRSHIQGKDLSLICSLSTFDVYTPSRMLKTPKAHAFGIKSQDSRDMFETPEKDYEHLFCMKDANGCGEWIEKLIRARVSPVPTYTFSSF